MTKEPKFTPGPYTTQEEWGCGQGEERHLCFHSIRRDGEIIASTWAGPQLHNANLLAAAPELFEALRQTLRMLEASYRQLGMNFSDNERVKSARAAIAKALGEEVS